jgi:hypothetical protein
VCLHGKKRNLIAKVSWTQLDENDAACGISVVDGNPIVSGFPKGRPLMNRDGGAEVAATPSIFSFMLHHGIGTTHRIEEVMIDRDWLIICRVAPEPLLARN